MAIYLGQYILTSSLGSGFLAKYGNIQCTESLHGVGKNIPKMTHIECAIYPMKITETMRVNDGFIFLMDFCDHFLIQHYVI
jgi:hypothetical protein